jgi:hypothetical protein
MSINIVATNVEELLASWIEAERNGVQFPVPLHAHWDIAGHRYKKNAFDLAESLLQEGLDFSLPLTVRSENGRKQKAMMLTVAALEHLCMAAHTQQGRDVRELYRQAKAKWDIVQKIAPEVASEVEMMHLKIELAKIESQKETAIAAGKQADVQLVQFRHIVTTTMPEPIQQKILGYTEVKTVEYRDRVIKEEEVVRDGSTISRTEACKRLGIMKEKVADCKTLDNLLARLPSDATRLSAVVQEYREVDVAYLAELAELWGSSNRNLYIGEP